MKRSMKTVHDKGPNYGLESFHPQGQIARGFLTWISRSAKVFLNCVCVCLQREQAQICIILETGAIISIALERAQSSALK